MCAHARASRVKGAIAPQAAAAHSHDLVNRHVSASTRRIRVEGDVDATSS
jgi:hypothetical protein